MKDLKDTLIKESKTKSQDIENYGKAWISEWGPSFCGNILGWFVKGVKEGMEKYPDDDPKFQKKCMDCIEDILKEINEKIY
jgi:hypothetical protein